MHRLIRLGAMDARGTDVTPFGSATSGRWRSAIVVVENFARNLDRRLEKMVR
jgi:hypothetical protein